MKIKPVRHKTKNVFKFQPFAERISNINVDIFHRVAHPNEVVSDEVECSFYQTIQKWNALNLTESYNAFRKELYDVVTLPQLLHKKEHVVNVLLAQLKLKNPLSLQPLLELVVALTKDLRKEFYPYYSQFLTQIIQLLETKDAEQLEWIFTCLAYLFKFLWRELIKDINSVFVSLLPLLSDFKPEYVNDFAVESFSFVARKVKDRSSFLRLILETVHTRPDSITSCGKLLFHVIKGVRGNFHSCAEVTLNFYLESLCDEKNLFQDVLFKILEQLVKNLVSNIHPQNVEVFWKCLTLLIEKCIDKKLFNTIEMYLKLAIQTLEHKQGRMVGSVDLLVKLYLKLVALEELPENVMLALVKFGSVLLISKSIKLSQEHASSLIRKTLLIGNQTVMLSFVQQLTNYSSFEVFVLPTFLKHYGQTLDATAFCILTKLVAYKSRLAQNGINLASWQKYPLDFSVNSAKVMEHLVKMLTLPNVTENQNNLDDCLSALICLPHIKAINNEAVFEQLRNNIKSSYKEINVDKPIQEMQKLLFLLLNLIECAVHIGTPEMVYELYRELDYLNLVLELTTRTPYTICCLRIVDLFATTCISTELISIENLRIFDNKLVQFYSSPYHQVRLLTAHIFSQFENLPELNNNKTNETWNIFSLCYNTESIESLVHTYRDQLHYLEQLDFDKPQGILCKNSEFDTIPLRYFLGSLYMNFQLLWEPIINLVTNYANRMQTETFWNIFFMELKSVVANIQQQSDVSFNCIVTNNDLISELYSNAFKIDNKPDFINYRILLWKAMTSFSNIVEARGKDIVPLMLTFMEDEYRKFNPNDAMTWNIKQTNSELTDAKEDEEDESDDDEDSKIKKELNRSVSSTGKSNLKSLLSHLMLFTKFRNPKSAYRETELYKLYLELLSHRNSDVQRAALDCIMVYKHKYLLPYRENLYSLIDDKKFKNEITFFRIDTETVTIQNEHRANLIPIVLRIVYSKMMAKTGLRTGGKSTGQLRRSLVLRFLAGCHQQEVMEFVHMAFKYYSKYLSDDLTTMIQTVIDKVDLEKFVPPKRLQSTLNLVSIMLEHFGGLMGPELLTYLLDILFIVGGFVLGAFGRKSLVHPGYLSALRNIRANCQTILARFFGRFDSFPWTLKQLNAVFDVFIWPWLDKLTTEGIHSPTALLKLFHQWSLNPRYFPLLVKEKGEEFPLRTVINLLLTKAHPSVTNTVLEILEKLLLLKLEEDESIEVPNLEVENVRPIADNILKRLTVIELNYGSCILLPFVPIVLETFKQKLAKKKKTVNHRELFILSRISELVWEPEICDTVLTLMLPLVVKKASANTSDETILQFLTTIHNLIRNVNQPEKHLRQIGPLFGELTSTPARKLLCELFAQVAKNEARFQETSTVMKELNAFDKKWLDQPDFDRRHKAFKLVNELIKSNSVQIELGSLLIYHCFYTIRHENDLAMRESAHLCLHSLIPNLIQKYQQKQQENSFLINELLFPMLRKGFKNKNDHYRQESIAILGLLARECPGAHLVLQDLNKLTNKVDLEVDFFENLIHLQVHRQIRALSKFNQICAELNSPLNPRTLTQFILPLVSFYLLSDKYKDKNNLIDAAIDAVKTICQLLPWHQYEAILKFYLGQLRHKSDFKKQVVRLAGSILDAYHFDLSKAMIDTQEVSKVKIQNKKSQELKVGEGSQYEIVEEENEDKLESDIDEVLDDIKDDLLEEESTKTVNIPVINKVTVLCPSAARRVLFSINTVLIPQLHNSMAELTQHDESHKINRKIKGSEREEADLQKVPLALAVVKLFQKLSTDILEENLPGVFMKLCTFLKSPLESVRRLTRETLQKIVATLGPNYLGLLISEMSSLLTKGFQVHVLVYTVHSLLVTLKDVFKPTDVDKCLRATLEICKVDIFGKAAEEKEILKVSEAKSTKSFDTFQILAQYITDRCLLDLIFPLKEILTTSHAHKQISNVQECLRRIVLGLVDNNFTPVKSLLIFSYGNASESIPEFLAHTKKHPNKSEIAKKLRETSDCFIIPKLPVYKSGARQNLVRNSSKTNAHLLAEFGLRLFYFILKRERIKDADYAMYVDPFVTVLKNSLNSRHVKMCTLTIQCLTWVMKYELPSMKESIRDITLSLFELLHKYAASGLSKGDNFDLVVAAFKATAVLVRDVKYYVIDLDQLKILLLYVEQDLHDPERQATAFTLLKAIISRKLIVPEIHEVMQKVAELSIVSETMHVRVQCRQILHQFLMEYPLGKKLETHLAFYMSQLKYELQPGRESALEMVNGIINSFPIEVLKVQSGMFFVLLGARLVNDESPECRKMVAKCIQRMLERLDKADRDVLFDIISEWFKDKQVIHSSLAAQLCGIFITVEKVKFTSRISDLVPLIKLQFLSNTPGQFVRISRPVEESSDRSLSKDHNLFQVLQMLCKLCSICPSFLERKEDIEDISAHVQVLLGYPHDWVRIAAAQFLGYVLTSLNIDHLAQLLINQQADECGYLYSDPRNGVKSLTLDLCAQLQPGHVKSDLAEQVIKNLVFIARVLQHIPCTKEINNETDEDEVSDKTKLSLLWLTKRMRKIVYRELAETPKSTILRTEVFKWIAGVTTVVDGTVVANIVHHLLAPLVRELSMTEDMNETLKQLAKEVAELIKNKIGSDLYISTVSKIQMQLNTKRAERKLERKQLAVTKPEVAAKKKIRLQERKKEAKKRKIEEGKNTKLIKKKRKVNTDVDVDVF